MPSKMFTEKLVFPKLFTHFLGSVFFMLTKMTTRTWCNGSSSANSRRLEKTSRFFWGKPLTTTTRKIESDIPRKIFTAGFTWKSPTLEKEKDLNQTMMTSGSMLLFQGVSFTKLNRMCWKDEPFPLKKKRPQSLGISVWDPRKDPRTAPWKSPVWVPSAAKPTSRQRKRNPTSDGWCLSWLCLWIFWLDFLGWQREKWTWEISGFCHKT